ncbi:MAG: squalene/phytoene synthase family protein [Anaerolineales bacterium]
MNTNHNLFRVLEETSRTFYIPVTRLPDILKETVAAAYLCMRAIDEIEDHCGLDSASKVQLLRRLSLIFQTQSPMENCSINEFSAAFREHNSILPEVTLRLGEWACQPPASIAPRIWDAAAAMADRMAQWVSKNWRIQTQSDLDGYTFSVAGAVGLLLCDIWAWFDGSQIDRRFAIQFGRGLQAVNILRNREEDLKRNVDFFPAGWNHNHMLDYANGLLLEARSGISQVPHQAYKFLVEIPLLLAEATLEVIKSGEEKLSRAAVMQIVQQAYSEPLE